MFFIKLLLLGLFALFYFQGFLLSDRPEEISDSKDKAKIRSETFLVHWPQAPEKLLNGGGFSYNVSASNKYVTSLQEIRLVIFYIFHFINKCNENTKNSY